MAAPAIPPTKVSLIVPTYRERENIPLLLAAICPPLQAWDHEIVFVDDSSTDGTIKAIQDAMRTNPTIRLIVREHERGLASAVLRGFRESTGTIVGSVNADLSHDAAVLPSMIRAIEQGAEMAVGSRRIRGGGFSNWPWYRKLGSDVATALTKRVLQVPLSDPMSGFYLMQRPVYERARDHLHGRGFKLMLDIFVTARPKHLWEQPYVFKDRQHGSTKVSFKVAAQFLQTLWRHRINQPRKDLTRRSIEC